jgi:splicing factor 3A subunit 3
MRALGLPNTKHFHEITKIEDALALAERLKQEGKQDARTVDTMEEIEDSEGNVYDKRTYGSSLPPSMPLSLSLSLSLSLYQC